MSEFEKTCTYCKAKIKLSDNKGGKWLPYNLDGSSHDRRNKQDTSTNKDARIEAVIKKVQSVITDLEDLMKKQ